ncbi:hypothetical protein Moror_12367 [Moniliophthora roreri MCA 2997]|uniref:DUF6593 domain-containing protein n=2 Tax=Moniliophthora roreri TaxID=221103 RepID=V2YW00_MONRO|nr:hypothetical protein Moror_12367 [Moniliophthora roreri MCA 2997]KAI3615756.1 hypothetical protein WG66_010202 [Moniliophthora roreri]
MPSSEPLTLILEPNNPCNTNISDSEDGRILYQVATEHAKRTVTRVRNTAGQTIASWEWRDTRSDIISIGNGAPVPVSAWLKKSMMPFKDTVTFQDAAGNTYKWKGNAPGLSLELFCEGDKRHPIARFIKPHRILNQDRSHPPQWTPAQLILDGRAEEIQDLVVISFLVLERTRRANENSTSNRADVLGQPISGIGIGTPYQLNGGGV